MEGSGTGAVTPAGTRRFGWPTLAEFVWFAYLAWALPSFFAKYGPSMQRWFTGHLH
ncbi:MAG: hypothetical protein HZB25_12940 [Candidatus Eisenbacteria bacterium]|nr:hypothetical protein [Candidatus Eisenbacteria bacterium]